MAKKKMKICIPSLLAGVAIGAAIIYLASSVIRTAGSITGTPMALGCGGAYTVDVSGQPYSITRASDMLNFPVLPSGMTSVTGIYPPPTGPY